METCPFVIIFGQTTHTYVCVHMCVLDESSFCHIQIISPYVSHLTFLTLRYRILNYRYRISIRIPAVLLQGCYEGYKKNSTRKRFKNIFDSLCLCENFIVCELVWNEGNNLEIFNVLSVKLNVIFNHYLISVPNLLEVYMRVLSFILTLLIIVYVKASYFI